MIYNTKLFIIVLLLCCYVQSIAQQAVNYTIAKTSLPIKVDGHLNEEAWNQASILGDFIQWVPRPDDPSDYKTEVKLMYDESSLFISATLYQPAALQIKQMTARDELNRCNADVFSVFLDTYHDQQNGFVFRVSSAGVQQDERISGGVEFGDISWDAVWTSKVSNDDEKWYVEIEIPYSAIRFSKLANQIWGMNFSRLVRKKNETSYWSALNVNKQGFLAQAGTLQGLKDLHPPIRLFLYPYLSGRYYKKPSTSHTERGFAPSGGLDVKYGINESFTIDATLIPDFSQVISDNLIRNLSPFEQQLTENRPFFTEGTELFNKANTFYSRRVGSQPSEYYSVESKFGDTTLYEIKKNPNVTTLYNALKFSGRNKKNVGIGIFNAIGSPMHATIFDKLADKNIGYETEPLANYNVIVIDKPLKGQSLLSFTNTNMMKKDVSRDANVASLQWLQFDRMEKHALSITAKWSAQHVQSFTHGTSFNIDYRKTSGKFRYYMNGNVISPQYNQSDMGLQFDFNESVQSFGLSYNQNKPKIKFLQTYRINWNNTLRQNVKPYVFKEYSVNASYFWLFKSFWDVTLEIESKPITPVNYYFLRAFNKPLQLNPYFWTGFSGSSDSRKKLFWGFNTGYGFSNKQQTGYFYGEQSLRYLIKNKIELSVKGSITRDDGNIGYATYDKILNEPIVAQRRVREYDGIVSLKYNYSPNVNLTARFRHYNTFISYRSFHTVDAEGYWRNRPYPYQYGFDENFNLQNVDIFLNWMFKPGSRLVLSYKQWLQDAYILNNQQENTYMNNVYEIVKEPKAFEVAVRLIYFLDYNHLRGHLRKP